MLLGLDINVFIHALAQHTHADGEHMSSDALICIDTSPTKEEMKFLKKTGKTTTTTTTAAAAVASTIPIWHDKRGTKRVVLEYRHLEEEIRNARNASGGASSGATKSWHDVSSVVCPQKNMV